MDDELRPLVCPDRNRGGRRSRLRRRSCVEQVSPAHQEHEPEKERAGEKPPARRGERVQHVVYSDNKAVTRVCGKCAETVSPKAVTL